MNTELLDTAVKLAALGTSGVCVAGLVWTGLLVARLPAQVEQNKHSALRNYMLLCLGVSVVSAVSGFLAPPRNACGNWRRSTATRPGRWPRYENPYRRVRPGVSWPAIRCGRPSDLSRSTASSTRRRGHTSTRSWSCSVRRSLPRLPRNGCGSLLVEAVKPGPAASNPASWQNPGVSPSNSKRVS